MECSKMKTRANCGVMSLMINTDAVYAILVAMN